MRNNKSINIYMGIIGEAYVDKETAYAVLLAAKKNILDVKAIINSANALFTPLGNAVNNAEAAIDSAVTVYGKLKNAIINSPKDSTKYIKLCALLSDLNLNDLDEDPYNGGNIYTALENKKFAEALQNEIDNILAVAKELLDANELNAVIRCKEYNIAKEIFESMIPEKTISPEELSDMMEAELIRRINGVQDNIDYVNIVSEEINNISQSVTNKIDMIEDGTDEFTAATNESLYWFAGSINPAEDSEFMEAYGFEKPAGSTTWRMFEKDEYGEYVLDENERKIDADFGIAGPLRKNKWFKQPLHLVQDGSLIAGVDGKLRSSEKFWYVTVPHLILTKKGLQYYKDYIKNLDSNATALSQYEWAAEWMSQYTTEEYKAMVEQNPDSVLVMTLCPVTPPSLIEVPEHTDYDHEHPVERNEWVDTNENNVRDDEDTDKNGYELVDSTLSINGITYDTWRVPATIYNKQRLNVYFHVGEVEDEGGSVVNGYYWYVGTKKLTGFSDDWMLIEHLDGETYSNNIGSNVFYVAIPAVFGIFENGVDQTLNANSAESMYTYVYSLSMNKVRYNVYVTGNTIKAFTGVVKPKTSTIEIPAYVRLEFNKNGVDKATVPAPMVLVKDTKRTLPSLVTVQDNNKQYTFKGWSLTADGEIVNSSYTVSEDVTLYAKWEEKDIFTISFNVNYGKAAEKPADMTVISGTTISLPGAITRVSTAETKYTFAGWQLDSTTYDAGDEFTVTANATFTAQWTEVDNVPTVTVRFFDMQESIDDLPIRSVPQGTEIELPVLENFEANNKSYHFLGWGTENGVVASMVSSPYTVNGNIQLVALWEVTDNTEPEEPEQPVEYSIVFKNGEETVKTVTGVTGTVVEAPTVTKEGYTFDGWSIDGENTVLPVANIGESDITYVALWTEAQQQEPVEPVEGAYYWYVGQTNPTNMSSITPIVTDTESAGWRLIGTTLPTYSASNKLWNANDIITTGDSLEKQYIAIPADSAACPRDGAGNDASTVNIYTQLSNITIDGVEYKVYETIGKMRKHNLDIF